MPAYKAVSVVRHGQRYSASWALEDKVVQVSSAYGSKSATLGKKDVALDVAESLLAELVDAWRARP